MKKKQRTPQYKVGKYLADYSPIDPASLEDDEQLKELRANSTAVATQQMLTREKE